MKSEEFWGVCGRLYSAAAAGGLLLWTVSSWSGSGVAHEPGVQLVGTKPGNPTRVVGTIVDTEMCEFVSLAMYQVMSEGGRVASPIEFECRP